MSEKCWNISEKPLIKEGVKKLKVYQFQCLIKLYSTKVIKRAHKSRSTDDLEVSHVFER